MHLTTRETDKLLVTHVGLLAQRRLARGVRLNHPEATALLTHVIQELIRDGKHTVADLMSIGKTILGRRHVVPSVVKSLNSLMVEGMSYLFPTRTFLTGTGLVTIYDPISSDDGNLEKALYGSFLPIPSDDLFPTPDAAEFDADKLPGTMILAEGRITLSEGRKRIRLRVINKGDRAVNVSSHYLFIESNPHLDFDRIKAYGYRLDVGAHDYVRFEPGETKTVTLVEIGGRRINSGGNNIAPGPVDVSRVGEITKRLQQTGFANTLERGDDSGPIEPFSMSRQTYCASFGPTTGDRVRLGSTNLWIKVEKDMNHYGDECSFGDAKNLRDGMGQASGRSDAETLDMVIVNALIIDWTGIFKADIGIKAGVIVGIGKAGNPDIMEGVDPAMVVGSCTEVITAEGLIVTAGAIDTHVHFTSPELAFEAIQAGTTTVIGGGTGPTAGTKATTCTPGTNFIREMLQAWDQLPVNVAITGKGNDSGKRGLEEQCRAGVAGLKLHEDWGTTPATIDTCLSVCDDYDVQCLLHADTLNESGMVEQTINAFGGRTIHCYHVEGAGGGHAPDIIECVQYPNVLPSSTTPTMPYTRNTLDEHIDMVMVAHNLNRNVPSDVAIAESRVRGETIAAEDVLQDLGAISMMSSDCHAMGRVGETILRTWNTAHKMKAQRGTLKEDEGTDADNFRVKRYISKYTINPAIAQGMSHIVGSVEVGKLADLVIWTPWEFGAKPNLVIKGGMVSYAQIGDPNGAIPLVEPIIMKPMFAPLVPSTSVAFVSNASIESGMIKSYNLRKRIEAVKNCRKIVKTDMKYNNLLPKIRVDPETYDVEADGQLCTSEPADYVPLGQQYHIY